MIAESFEFPTPALKSEELFDKMPWNDISMLLTPLSEGSLILTDKHDQSVQHDFNSPLEALLTPMSSTSSAELDLSTTISDDLIFGGSPLFDDAELDDPNTWESLFNDVAEPAELKTEHLSGLHLPPTSEFSSPILEEISLKPEVITPVSSEVSLKRKRSESSDYKKDALGITAYNRKPRSAPLVPIEEEDTSGDTVQAKRARNTAAARRSRARKMERMTQLEEKVEELVSMNKSLESENSELRSEMSALRKLCGLE